MVPLELLGFYVHRVADALPIPNLRGNIFSVFAFAFFRKRKLDDSQKDEHARFRF